MEKPKKILYVITQSEWGGAQRYIFDLATNLTKERFEAFVAAGGNGQLFVKLQGAGVKTIQLRFLVRQINPLFDLLGLIELYLLMRRIRPDVVHLNSSKAGVLGSIAAKLAGVPTIIYTAHGFVFNEPLSTWKRLFYLWSEKLTGRLKTKIICIYAGDRQTAIEQRIAKPEKLVVIYNGIATGRLRSRDEARTELKLPSVGTIIGTIANFYPAKGLPYLLEAAREVIKSYPNVLFAIMGDGELRAELEQMISRLHLESNVRLLGRGKPDAQDIFPAFDLFVLPSVKEGLPYTLLEAMNAGIPIIATRVGGVQEMIEDGVSGRLVPPSDPPALAEAILATLTDKQKATEMAARGKGIVQERFLLRDMIEKTAKLY